MWDIYIYLFIDTHTHTHTHTHTYIYIYKRDRKKRLRSACAKYTNLDCLILHALSEGVRTPLNFSLLFLEYPTSLTCCLRRSLIPLLLQEELGFGQSYFLPLSVHRMREGLAAVDDAVQHLAAVKELHLSYLKALKSFITTDCCFTKGRFFQQNGHAHTNAQKRAHLRTHSLTRRAMKTGIY